MKTYNCKLCGTQVRENAIPRIIASEELCVECYQTKYRAFGEALKAVVLPANK